MYLPLCVHTRETRIVLLLLCPFDQQSVCVLSRHPFGTRSVSFPLTTPILPHMSHPILPISHQHVLFALFTERMSTTMLFAGLKHPSRPIPVYSPEGGVILSAKTNRVRCAYGADGAIDNDAVSCGGHNSNEVACLTPPPPLPYPRAQLHSTRNTRTESMLNTH